MASAAKPPVAKLFMHGRSQAVRLPKEFRLPGTEVRVSRLGDKVVLEPMEKPPFDVQLWLRRLESYRDVPFPDMADEPPAKGDDPVSFD